MPEQSGMSAADLLLLDPDGTFPSRLAEDRAVLAGLAHGLWKAAAEAKQRRLAKIEALAHRLGGAAGTFGYEAVSAAALELEDRIATWRGAADPAGSRSAIEARGAIDAQIEDGLAHLVKALDDVVEGR